MPRPSGPPYAIRDGAASGSRSAERIGHGPELWGSNCQRKQAQASYRRVKWFYGLRGTHLCAFDSGRETCTSTRGDAATPSAIGLGWKPRVGRGGAWELRLFFAGCQIILNMRSQVRWPRGMRSDEILHSSTRNIKSCAKYGNQSFKSTTRRNTCTTINLTANTIAEREASLRIGSRSGSIRTPVRIFIARPWAFVCLNSGRRD